MEAIVEMFWNKLYKKITRENSERGHEPYSVKMNDYSFIGKVRTAGNSLTLTFKENTSGRLIELKIKIVN